MRLRIAGGGHFQRLVQGVVYRLGEGGKLKKSLFFFDSGRDILERDKKSQLLADYDLLASYMDDYKYYWENEASLVVNLNQVKNIKRNAMKDVRSYTEQIESMISAKKNLLKTMQKATKKK